MHGTDTGGRLDPAQRATDLRRMATETLDLLVVGGGVGHGWLPGVVGVGGAFTTEGAISGPLVTLHSQLCLTLSSFAKRGVGFGSDCCR